MQALITCLGYSLCYKWTPKMSKLDLNFNITLYVTYEKSLGRDKHWNFGNMYMLEF